jgi:hypothetical protein
VVVLTTGYSGSRELAGLEPEFLSLVSDAVLWRTIRMHELDGDFDEPTYWHVSACIREWQPGLFDPIVRLVSDDVLSDVMIADPDCRWVLHPYDGGMDVIMESSAARDRLGTKDMHCTATFERGTNGTRLIAVASINAEGMPAARRI